ncbi:MAG: hypothetical protein AAF616_13810 [Bacteroidota bacterium]
MRLTIWTLAIVMLACQPQKETGLKELKEEVLAIHDEVMPKIGELRRVRKDLMKRADSVSASDSTISKSLIETANELGEASESMMQWMREYEPDFQGTDEEVAAYLELQKEAIIEVKYQMEGALTKGNEKLESPF